ncbi:hypothetical protein Y032_0622g753 [Ancylostoma ceylanicum]|uniref:Uncharacterized protein n=1 Tax=Ancylostoma ceylanicum TaxID=53326 RepID=A0A016WKX5_9BILA|nr:hypothetical protein Y032_0622g753 [Ancylostoma ceylanicum]
MVQTFKRDTIYQLKTCDSAVAAAFEGQLSPAAKRLTQCSLFEVAFLRAQNKHVSFGGVTFWRIPAVVDDIFHHLPSSFNQRRERAPGNGMVQGSSNNQRMGSSDGDGLVYSIP